MRWNYLSIPKLQRLHRWSLGMDKFHPIHYNGCNYLSMLGLKLNHVSKSGHRRILEIQSMRQCVDTLSPGQNCHHFADDIFKCTFLNENIWISINILVKFVPKGRNNNILALVQIIAWRRPLSEPMMVRLPTHTCVTLPLGVNVIYCIVPL